MRKLALAFAGLTALCFGALAEGCKEDCTIGAEGCSCTEGNGCDPGLSCLSGLCVNAGPNPDEIGDDDPDTTTTTTTTTTGDGDTAEGESDSDAGSTGPKLDTLQETSESTTGPCMETGCKKVDMLFALDGSLSMIEEIDALKAGQAFLGIVDTLEGLNCGGIDYRIGVTDDNDAGWLVPNNWADPDPWFDSQSYTPSEISVHFQAAASKVGQNNTPLGCEHVLTSAVNLLGNDQSGFLRDDALLVLVLVSDVDDLGWYDQVGMHNCGACNIGPLPVQTLQDTLVALKGGDAAGVSAIVIGGDPNVAGGPNFCGQPGSCCGPLDCQALHSERLWEFAAIQAGMNGYTANICDGPPAVPDAVQTALQENIDLACQEFEPVG